MAKRWFLSIAALLFLAGVGLYSYQRGGDATSTRSAMLALLPADVSAVVFADIGEIRSSAFAAELYHWAPQPHVDPEYVRFLDETGFDYERDLDRIAIAFKKHESATTLFAIADGRFDQKKIEAYASQSGSRVRRDGHEFLLLPVNGSARKISLVFLRADRIALTDDADPSMLFSRSSNGDDERQWRDRFERLAGSPIFAVMRQEAFAGQFASAHAPGGFQSPQLATLLDQLLWITLAGKPEGDRLRVVAEGEYSDDRTARQLNDVLNGILVLAQTGLNTPDTRKQLDPQLREAYLEILRGADVSRIDRGETKSVRAIFDVTPKLLDSARTLVPSTSASGSVSSEPARPHHTPNHSRSRRKSGR